MLLTLSLAKLLDVWTELETALHCENGFGTDTAEIYIYKLTDVEPSAYLPSPSLAGQGEIAMGIGAGFNLNSILIEFCKRHEALTITIDGKVWEESTWLMNTGGAIFHRVHVQVKRKERT